MEFYPSYNDYLKRFELKLSLEEFAALEKKILRKTAVKGKVLFRENKAAINIYELLSGRVKLEHETVLNRPVIFSIVEAGDYFGFGAMHTAQKNLITATALTDIEYNEIPYSVLDHLFATEHNLYKKLFAHFFELNIKMYKYTLLMLAGTTEAKLAYALLLLAGKQNNLKTPKEEIALMTGLTRETVSRTLKNLKKKKLIELPYREITITDRKGLEKVVKQRKGDMH